MFFFLSVSNSLNDLLVDFNSTQINVSLQELVVIVQEHWSVDHRRKADRRNASLSEISAIGAAWEDLDFILYITVEKKLLAFSMMQQLAQLTVLQMPP